LNVKKKKKYKHHSRGGSLKIPNLPRYKTILKKMNLRGTRDTEKY